MGNLEALYERLRMMPSPNLAKAVGDVLLYETLLAGCANRVLRGGAVDAAELPTPDLATLTDVDSILGKGSRSDEEIAFLEYFNLLEEIRSVLGAITEAPRD